MIKAMYLSGEKYIKDRALTWTQYSYYETSNGQILETPVDNINPFNGKVTISKVYWDANVPGTFAVSNPFKLTVGSKTYTIRLFAYPESGEAQLAAMTEELFESAYQNQYKPK